jgi:DNA polymerase-1
MTKKLVLVDGSSYLFRAYHALPSLTNAEGEPTGAIYGVINMLNKLYQMCDTPYIGIVFDDQGKNFRHELFANYKANRSKMDEDLKAQIAPLYQLIRAQGFPLITMPNVEADDVIGTLAKKAEANGWQVLISTGDKDMAQLVSDRIILMDTMKNITMDKTKVMQDFGVMPAKITDLLALTGDASDNIPGLDNVGPKTAVKWLNQYGSLSDIISNANTIKGKAGESLRQNYEKLSLAYELVTIRCDLALDFAFDEIIMQKADDDYLKYAYAYYGFKRLLANLKGSFKEQTSNNTSDRSNNHFYTIITDFERLTEWLNTARQNKILAIDTETTSLDPMQAQLVGIAIAVKPEQAAYIPIKHEDKTYNQLSLSSVREAFKPVLQDDQMIKVGHNLKYDLKILAHYDLQLCTPYFDTMLESYVYDSASTRHNMDALAQKYLNIEPTSYETLAGKGKKQKRFDAILIDQAGPYACEDADITLRLHQYLWPLIKTLPNLESLFLHEEMPVMAVLDQMERTGVKIDQNLLNEQSRTIASQLKAIEKHVCDLAGCQFNLASHKQLREVLFDRLNLPINKKTPGGVPSTSEEVLQELALNYEMPALILKHRHLAKLKTTYTDKLPNMVNPQTDRIHTSYHQAIAITGRLSSQEPNLQNIPIKSETGRQIRKAFIAPYHHKILAADYSQIELRIMAHLSGDTNLIQSFQKGQDIHKATASEILQKPVETITDEQRRQAKAVNFGLIYGMSPYGLARQLNISYKQAKVYVDTYFERYPQVKAYMHLNQQYALEHGYVETIYGRRLYLPDIRSRNRAFRKGAERVAINAPMQGSAADIIKRAMIQIQNWIDQSMKDKVKMLMQVHDELIFEIDENFVMVASHHIKQFMEDSSVLNVPLLVDIGIGDNWHDAH